MTDVVLSVAALFTALYLSFVPLVDELTKPWRPKVGSR
jgi:hypothetical protein